VHPFVRTRRPVRDQVSGEADSDAALIRELYAGLRKFAAVVGFRAVEPDDLVQEALERVLRIGPLRDLDDPMSYLRRTMLNIVSNERRSTGRQRRALTRLMRASEPEPLSYPSDLAELQAVPAETRALLYLAVVERWTYAEIGGLLGCTEEAARTRAARARRQLRMRLENEDG
jgi:RNA polymerase sigma factor (sigma-70 family)